MVGDDGVMVVVLLTVALPFAWLCAFLLRMAGPVAFGLFVIIGAGMAALLAGSGWAAAGAVGLGASIGWEHRRRNIDQLAKAKALIRQHAQELAVRRSQLVHLGAYGVVDRKAWDVEIGHFIGKVVAPAVGGLSPLGETWAKIRDEVEHAAVSVPITTNFTRDLSPIDYEKLVADTLRRYGWDTRTTQASGATCWRRRVSCEWFCSASCTRGPWATLPCRKRLLVNDSSRPRTRLS